MAVIEVPVVVRVRAPEPPVIKISPVPGEPEAPLITPRFTIFPFTVTVLLP